MPPQVDAAAATAMVHAVYSGSDTDGAHAEVVLPRRGSCGSGSDTDGSMALAVLCQGLKLDPTLVQHLSLHGMLAIACWHVVVLSKLGGSHGAASGLMQPLL